MGVIAVERLLSGVLTRRIMEGARFLPGWGLNHELRDPNHRRRWTAVDLVERFGAIPLHRIVQNPEPGSATEQDVIDLDEHEDRLCELIDGTLVEKTVGAYESFLAAALIRLLGDFVVRNNLGVVLGEAGMMRLAHGLVRIPDVSFISLGRYPPGACRASLFPTSSRLGREVISRRNIGRKWTTNSKTISRLACGLVWYVYHSPRRECGFTSVRRNTRWSARRYARRAARCCPAFVWRWPISSPRPAGRKREDGKRWCNRMRGGILP